DDEGGGPGRGHGPLARGEPTARRGQGALSRVPVCPAPGRPQRGGGWPQKTAKILDFPFFVLRPAQRARTRLARRGADAVPWPGDAPGESNRAYLRLQVRR